ncbi:MAG: hypothetical protein ABW163_07940 [Luteimonas sp.]
MRTPAPPTPPRQESSAAARYLVVFVIGLIVGLLLVVVLLRAVEGRKTWQDRYPHALMQLYQAQTAQLSGKLEADRCAATDTLAHLQTLRALSNDLETAFPDLRDHRTFVGHAAAMRQTLDTALASPPTQCESLRATTDAIGNSCGNCHRDMAG